MFRRTVPAFAALLAVAALLPLAPPAEAGRGGDALGGAAKSRSKEFKRTAKDAEKIFKNAVKNLSKGVKSGATSTEDAVTSFGNALGFYASKVHAAADDAAEGFAGDAVGEMSASGDPSEPGAAAGDGGSYDDFAESVRKDMAKLRGKALKLASKFQKAIARTDGHRGGTRVILADWTFQPQPAPDVGGAVTPIDRPARLWGAVATRLTDGRIIVTAFGSAAPAMDNEFDVRIVRGFQVEPIGDFLRDGGMDVNGDGWWNHTGAINDPFGGETVPDGNAQIYFGVEPDELDEPRRREHGGNLSIP